MAVSNAETYQGIMSRAPWLTRSQVDRIARLLQDGATSREIERLMGVSQGTVSNVRMGKVAGKRRTEECLSAWAHAP